MKKKNVADSLLITAIVIFFFLGLWWIVYPTYTPYEAETVTKDSRLYNEPIYLTLHWKTDDEIQVGKMITLWVEIRGLPYNETSKDIEMQFNEKQLNYFSSDDDVQNNKISQTDRIKFTYNSDQKTFQSELINLRFIIPTDISVELCDYNLQNPCNTIEDIIHPAPYDLASRIETNRISIGVSLVVAAFSSLVVWSRLRPDNADSTN